MSAAYRSVTLMKRLTFPFLPTFHALQDCSLEATAADMDLSFLFSPCFALLLTLSIKELCPLHPMKY